ncbi:hypothetical protein SNE40_014525 [Patella caerulea]|uniref:RING-type E3 ubiquitin transferase n=1 Tax=Patella caerulea TaxID=87958 RepID=A0AAN8JID7_PATCE
MTLLGQRVIRGPDWSAGDVDGGEGHVGTVVTVGGLETAEVLWDNGTRNTCRIGHNGHHDLRVFDNGTTGVRHDGTDCTVCSERGIFGMRWTCNVCSDCHLCPVCYVTDQHDTHHDFTRYTTPGDKGVPVPKRATSVKAQTMGIFPGAIVQRGHDWKYGDQDGGADKTGEVISIEHGDKNSSTTRNKVRVKWMPSGSYHIYRLGAEDGKVDLQFVLQARGTPYYRDHLPVCENQLESNRAVVQRTGAQNIQESSEALQDDDNVCIVVSSANLEELQKQHCGYTKGMASCIGKIGKIRGFTPNGDAMVEFGGTKFRFHPRVLKKVYDLNVGDIVRILPDEQSVETLQDGHGGYNPQMKQYLGKVGKVAKKDSDGDVVVEFGRRIFLYNPGCCTPAPGQTVYDEDESDNDSGDSGNQLQQLENLNHLMMLMMGGLMQGVGQRLTSDLTILALYKAISEGDTSEARSIIQRDPSVINKTFKGVTPLIFASHQGQETIVEELLKKGADINIVDHLGNTAVAAAIIGEKKRIAKYLIGKGCDITVTDNNGRTAIHSAAIEDFGDIISLLIQKGCDANIQDKVGDTALHDAISKDSTNAINTLCKSQSTDLTLVNRKGFNPLHHAALRGNTQALESILMRNKGLVNVKKADGFTALHVAAINNHDDCARILIQRGGADVNSRDLDGDTPLSVAAGRGFVETSKLLIDRNANVNAVNTKKETPLHAALSQTGSSMGLGDPMLGLGLLLGLGINTKENRIKTACTLIENGADVEKRNSEGKTPLECCSDDVIKTAVNNFIRQRRSQPSASRGTIFFFQI